MRCCYRSSLLAAAAFTCLLSGSSLVSSAAATSDRVLVIGAHEDLVHDAIATTPSAFSPAGLAQLAMDAMRLSTGKIVHLSSDSTEQLTVQSPAQADVFKHVDAYAMVYVDSADAAVLNTVNSAAQSGYHKVFDLTADAAAGPSTKIPAVLARALQQSVGAELLCAGSATVCQSDVLPAVDVTQAQLEDMFAKHVFLDSTNAADTTLARELAQTQQLTAAIQFKTKVPSALYAVQFSSISALSASKQSRARDAVASQIQELLSALQTVYPRNSGAQIVALTGAAAVPASPPLVKLDAVTAFSRMLLAFNDPVASSLDQDEDDDDTTTTVNGTTTSNVTIEDIAEYQIILWTSVMLGAVLILVIIAMCNMAPKRDSLLYAKFTTSNGSRKFD